MPDPSTAPVLQLRVALTSRNYERLLRFYCAGLGLEPAQVWTQDGGHGLMLDLGQGTLELFDEAYAGYVDGLEAGGRISGPVRLALQVPDLDAALKRLVAHGAMVVHPPVRAPWGGYNARVQDPDGLQVTLFQSGSVDEPPAAGAA
jgi:catechol 2,3-dioxygenase-like lactoylglutathione lyase family enzyme